MLPTLQSIASILLGISGGMFIGRCITVWDEDVEFDRDLAVIGLALIASGFALAVGAAA